MVIRSGGWILAIMVGSAWNRENPAPGIIETEGEISAIQVTSLVLIFSV